LQVHDALWFEIHKSETKMYLPQIKQIMENPIDNFNRVKLKVDGHRVGTIL